jgi:hypothetical protein
MTNNTSAKFWTELTETQTEAINGGVVIGNFAAFSKLTSQNNGAVVAFSGNAIGAFNAGGVVVAQTNVA